MVALIWCSLNVVLFDIYMYTSLIARVLIANMYTFFAVIHKWLIVND